MAVPAPAIEAADLSYDFGGGRGVFDLSFSVDRGEVLGWLGPNGAGKTTTMRLLTGLMRPRRGRVRLLGHDAWSGRERAHRILGYLPGEIGLPAESSGGAVLDLLAAMRGLRDRAYERSLVDRFELDLRAAPHCLSKGNRQKLGLVAALQHDPPVLLLDEPTSGFDPLMQERFVAWLLEEKRRGKAILLSSHQFSEVERTADRIAVLRQGRMVALAETGFLAQRDRRGYHLRFGGEADAQRFAAAYPAARVRGCTAEVEVQGPLRPLVDALAGLELLSLRERQQSLEDAFLRIYAAAGGEGA